MSTKVTDPDWLDWKVGHGKEFEDLNELLMGLRKIRHLFGPNCGYAGGPIDLEISLVEEMINK